MILETEDLHTTVSCGFSRQLICKIGVITKHVSEMAIVC